MKSTKQSYGVNATHGISQAVPSCSLQTMTYIVYNIAFFTTNVSGILLAKQIRQPHHHKLSYQAEKLQTRVMFL